MTVDTMCQLVSLILDIIETNKEKGKNFLAFCLSKIGRYKKILLRKTKLLGQLFKTRYYLGVSHPLFYIPLLTCIQFFYAYRILFEYTYTYTAVYEHVYCIYFTLSTFPVGIHVYCVYDKGHSPTYTYTCM